MSYGMQIRTVNGLESIENLRSLREIYRATTTSASGSQFIGLGATASNTAVFFNINDGGNPPNVSWSGSTFIWSAISVNANPTSNFEYVICRFK